MGALHVTIHPGTCGDPCHTRINICWWWGLLSRILCALLHASAYSYASWHFNTPPLPRSQSRLVFRNSSRNPASISTVLPTSFCIMTDL
eukprot:5795947-Amphidinium_carterae.1